MDSGPIQILQANINHCAGAQDLLFHALTQWRIDVAVVAEPYYVPSRNTWVGDLNDSVAIFGSEFGPPLVVREKGHGFLAVDRGEYTIFGVYFSPNRTLAEYEAFLGELLAAVLRAAPRPALVAGDFNAKSTAWGSRLTDARGNAVLEWTVLAGLSILNRGNAPTCVRPQGSSIVDLSFATPAVGRLVQDWRVEEGTETLSDHQYIRFSVSSPDPPRMTPRTSESASEFPRWALTGLDVEALKEAAEVEAWTPRPTAPIEVEEEAQWFRGALTRICDASMSRARGLPSKRQIYWWTETIAELRHQCVRARRSHQRQIRRRTRHESLERRLRAEYSAAKSALHLAIQQAKEAARQEMLAELDRDPWGRPYRTVRNKFGHGPPVVETLPPEQLAAITSALFPTVAEFEPLPNMDVTQPEVVPPVSEGEMDVAIQRLSERKTAPGPDGIPGKVWVKSMGPLKERMRDLFSACLTQAEFPQIWKEGRLVLLKKDGRPADSPSAYRPIVLLDEAGKLFERVIASRVIKHLEQEGPNLSGNQFGFRAQRSTVDAILEVKRFCQEQTENGAVVLAVSFDIANAFNTLPFEAIEDGLEFHGVPSYLRRILRRYLRRRKIVCVRRDGRTLRFVTWCGVPQGSVLGPLLWNIGYDRVLRAALLRGLRIVCYADDTYLLARGVTFEEAIRLATVGASQVVARIEAQGLKVAVEKTEAIFFYGPRKRPPTDATLRIKGVSVPIGSEMKYLGLVLDSKWSFTPHFRRLAPRLKKTAMALGRLLPNIGGPGTTCRRLYTGVLQSMALYGAPVWAEHLSAKNKALLRSPQRTMALRIIRGYRTVATEAALALAGSPPWDLEARVQADVYFRSAEVKGRGERVPPDLAARWRRQARIIIMRTWEDEMASPTAGRSVVAAIRPILREWIHCPGTLTYRVVQVLTGHGCFGHYLHHNAQREQSPQCHHCPDDDDTAQHTLVACPAWMQQRAELCAVIGLDFALPAILTSMVRSREAWDAVTTFCETVMSLKEAAEREREANEAAHPARRRRRGRRRALHERQLPP